MSAERTEQIYDAVIECLKRYGASGATLERIAATAGMSRGHVRHFVGNRDRLLVGAARHFYGIHGDSPTWSRRDGGTFTSTDELFDYLFGESMTRPDDDNVLVHEFIDASRSNPELAAVLGRAYDALRTVIGAVLEADSPNAPTSLIRQTSYGILCLSLGNAFIAEVDLEAGKSPLSRSAADSLLLDFRHRTTG